jgi:hypothetical protein
LKKVYADDEPVADGQKIDGLIQHPIHKLQEVYCTDLPVTGKLLKTGARKRASNHQQSSTYKLAIIVFHIRL